MEGNQMNVCNIRNISRIAYAMGLTIWSYRDGDLLEAMMRPGFFDGVKELFNGGDIIILSAADGGAIRWIDCQGALSVLH